MTPPAILLEKKYGHLLFQVWSTGQVKIFSEHDSNYIDEIPASLSAQWATDLFNNVPGISTAAPVADFSADPLSGDQPLSVAFTDQSTNSPTGWIRDFGDGSPAETTQNPTHVYVDDGEYTVTLTAINQYGDDTKTIDLMVTVNAVPVPVTDFSADDTTPTEGDTVTFTDLSTNTPTAWERDFGDGSPVSTDQNPTHVYAVAGTYDVSLKTTNGGGSDTEIKTGYIVVAPAPVAPVAEFMADDLTPTTADIVTFTDQSTNTPTSRDWDFGDGTPHDTTQNPTHTYSTPGTYDVTLIATNIAGSDTEAKIGYIVVSAP